MRERLINRRQQGDLGEASAIEWLTRQRATVSLPLGHSPDYDLIAELDARMFRVQVKTSTCRSLTPNGHERWSVSVCTNGGNQSWTGTTKWFDPTKVDALFVLVGDGRRWCIPAGAVEGARAVQLGGAKYSEYEVAPAAPIQPLVYGEAANPSTLVDPETRGSVEAGESSEPVKFVPMAEWVRIPPPPSSATDPPPDSTPRRPPKFSRTQISGKNLITIPSVPFRAAGLAVGDRLELTADGPGRVIVERIDPPG